MSTSAPLSPNELRRRRLAALSSSGGVGGGGNADDVGQQQQRQQQNQQHRAATTIVRPWDKKAQYKKKKNNNNGAATTSSLKRPPPPAAAASAKDDYNGAAAAKKKKSSTSSVYDLTVESDGGSDSDDDEVVVVETTAAPKPSQQQQQALSSCGSSLSSPIKLFATLLDEKERKRNDQHSNNNNHWSRTQCMTLREMLGFDDNNNTNHNIEWIVIANYLIDTQFVLEEIPELVSVPKVVVFYGMASSFAQWKNMVSGNNVMDPIQLDPSASTSDPSNPCDVKIPYGVHHTKLFLVGYSNGTIRVVVHTANLRRSDVHNQANAAYVQDFPLKSQYHQGRSCNSNNEVGSSSSSSSEFEDTLVSYLNTYKYNKKHQWNNTTMMGGKHKRETLIDTIRRYDFSSALAILIPSTPGYHKLDCDNILGHLKLRDAVARYSAVASVAGGPDNDSNTKSIVCQFSSIGSLSEKYLNELQISMDTQLARRATGAGAAGGGANNNNKIINRYKKQTTTTPLRLQLVYPTVEEVRASVEGYVGGGSVPGNQKNLSKPFLQSLLRKWSSSSSSSPPPPTTNPLWKGRNIPHIKTYYQFSRNEGESQQHQQNQQQHSLDWFVVTSHNMSKAAWGEVQNSAKYGGQRLFIRHWELGVYISPQTLRSQRLVPWSPSTSSNTNHAVAARGGGGEEGDSTTTSSTVPIPFPIEPDLYGPRDEPWAHDRRYSKPDNFGRYSVMG